MNISKLLLAASLASLPAFAQQLELPRPSPFAKVSAQVGLTDIAVDYSSPGVKGRTIYGGVVPFGQLWRTGANQATKITFSKDVEIGQAKVPAGSYSIFSIPGKESWTFIINKNATASTGNYKEAEDVVRVQVKPEAIAPRERMAMVFADTTDEATRLDVEWEKTRAGLPIRTGTAAQVAEAIGNLEKNAWRPYTNAARYLLEAKKDAATALRLVDKSIELHEDWLNDWTKAQLLHAQGNTAEARKLAEKAEALGAKAGQGFFFADEVKKALAEWK